MKLKNIAIAFSLILSFSSELYSQSVIYQKSISVEELQSDYEVLKNVLKAITRDYIDIRTAQLLGTISRC